MEHNRNAVSDSVLTELAVSKADLQSKNPIAVLTFLYAIAPQKVQKLAGIQGVLLEDITDAENLGRQIIDKEVPFNLKRMVSALRISASEISGMKDRVIITGRR